MRKRVAYLGPEGTYTEDALIAYNPKAERIPYPTISGVVKGVLDGEVPMGIVPIENSLEGSVTSTLDLLTMDAERTRIMIYAEVVLPITHYLMAGGTIALCDITRVLSHPQALAQCRRFLEQELPFAQQVDCSSTTAAGLSAREAPRCAAIASYRTAQLHGLAIIREGIQDNSTNATRFVVLALEDFPPVHQAKTSLCFVPPESDRPGVLYRALGGFAQRDINLTKIESRPTKDGLGRYMFLLDLDGHRQDSLVQEAIVELRQQGRVQILGSYPKWLKG